MNSNKLRRAVYAGSFDPPTKGHLDIIRRSARLVDELIVAVVRNPNKHSLFTLAEREEMIRHDVASLSNVVTASFSGLLVDFMREQQANFIVRGLRSAADFEAEFSMALINDSLAPEIETIFFACSPEHIFVSSSAVREIASLGGKVSHLVSEEVRLRLQEKFNLILD